MGAIEKKVLYCYLSNWNLSIKSTTMRCGKKFFSFNRQKYGDFFTSSFDDDLQSWLTIHPIKPKLNEPKSQSKPNQSVILPIKMTSIVKYWVVMMSNVGIKFKPFRWGNCACVNQLHGPKVHGILCPYADKSLEWNQFFSSSSSPQYQQTDKLCPLSAKVVSGAIKCHF